MGFSLFVFCFFFISKTFRTAAIQAFPTSVHNLPQLQSRDDQFFFLYLEHATVNIADADICKVFTSLYMSDLALPVLQK